MHPGIGAEVGYDSNWYMRSHKDSPNANGEILSNGGVREAGVLRVTPSFTIGSLGPQRLGQASPSFAYRASIAGTYREFIGTEVNAERNMNVHAFVRGDILPGRPIGVGFFGGYQRMVQPSAIPAAGGFSFDRSDVNAGAEVIAIPGQGTLDMHLGYQFFGALYESGVASPLSNLTHEISFKNRWKFRPKTALFTETSLQFVSYPNSGRSALVLNDAVPLRTRAGLTGLILPRLSVLGALGYSATFLAGGALAQTSQYDSINAQVEATIYLSGTAVPSEDRQGVTAISTFTLGYNRDVLTGSAQSFANKPSYLFGGGQNTVLGSYTGLDKFYGRLSYMFAGRAILALDGFVDLLTMPGLFDAGGAPVRNTVGGFMNIRPGASLFGEYRFVDSFGLNLTIDYAQQISDVAIPVGGNQVFDLNNRRVQASLGARWFM